MRLNCNYILNLNSCPSIFIHDSSFWRKIHFVMTVYLYRVENYIEFDLSGYFNVPDRTRAGATRKFDYVLFFKVLLIHSRGLPITRTKRAMSIIHV